MSSRRFVVIANPHAGRGRAARVLAQTTEVLRRAGADVRGELTVSIGHAAELGELAARDGSVAVAVGGDGLLRAVAAGASRHGGTIGIVPAGRGNDFARTVGIDKKAVDENIARLLTAEPVRADCIAVVGAQGEDVALGNVYAGFDSLSNVTANDLRVNLGGLSYMYAALRVALTMPVLELRVTVDGETRAYRGSGVAIGNSRFYGGNVPFAPSADIHDGLLDVVLFEQTNARSRVSTLWSMRSGAHVHRDGVHHLRGREIRVEVDPQLEAYSDGDPITPTPFTATVMPGAIGLLRP